MVDLTKPHPACPVGTYDHPEHAFPLGAETVTCHGFAECLDHHEGDCKGPVEYRMPLSGTGRSFPRCEGHWDARLDREEQIRERYGHPDSSMPPSDFDPTYAGERWDDDY